MKKVAFVVLMLLSQFVFGQQAIPSSKLAWDQPAPTLTEALMYVYHYYADGDLIGVPLAGIICGGTTSPFQCQANFPAFTPGSHSIAMTAANIAGKSVKSAALSFVFVVTPAAPLELRIQ